MASALAADPRRLFAVILTALAKERDAILRHCGNSQPTTIKNRVVHRASLGQQREVVVMCLGEMGNISSAIAIAQAISVWNPQHILLAGIAGGIGGDGRLLGDVIVAEQIVEYESGKATPSAVERRYGVYRPAYALLDVARQMDSECWSPAVTVPRPDGTTGRVRPRVHFGVVASGARVVKDPTLTTELSDDWARLIGIEMEGAGAAAAAYQSGTQPGIILVKGISDWANPEKNDLWQEYAADTAAAFALAALRDVSDTIPGANTPVLVNKSTFSGKQKLAICSRLTTTWHDLADYFEITPAHRARFTPGREAHGIWEWLEERDKLTELRSALVFLDRADLVRDLET